MVPFTLVKPYSNQSSSRAPRAATRGGQRWRAACVSTWLGEVKPVRRACMRGWIFGQDARARAERAKCSFAGLKTFTRAHKIKKGTTLTWAPRSNYERQARQRVSMNDGRQASLILFKFSSGLLQNQRGCRTGAE